MSLSHTIPYHKTMMILLTLFLIASTLPLHSGAEDLDDTDGAPISPSDAPVCAEGWEMLTVSTFGGQITLCFKKLPDNLGWGEAQGQCWSQYSHLMLLTRDLLRSFSRPPVHVKMGDILQKMGILNKPFWVGMHLDHGKLWWHGKTLQSVDRKPYKWNWYRDHLVLKEQHNCGHATFVKTITRSNSGPDDPSTFERRKKRAVTLNTYSYNISMSLDDGNNKLPAVCVNHGFSPKLQQDERLCGSGWSGSVYLDSCIWFSGPQKLNHSMAELFCRQKGGHLIVISSNYESKILNLYMKNKPPSQDIWLGFTKSGSTYSWMNGQIWQSDGNVNSTALVKGCGSFSPYSGREEWFVQDCSAQIQFLCEKPVNKLEPSTISQHPRSLQFPISYIQNPKEDHLSMDPASRKNTLSCTVKNYYPHFPIVWVKDGIRLPAEPAHTIKNGVSYLQVDASILRSTGQSFNYESLQGYYWCETVSVPDQKRIVSQKALVRFEDVKTYVGHLRTRGEVITYAQMNQESVFVKPDVMIAGQPQTMLNDLFRDTQKNIPGLKLTSVIDKYRKGSVLIDYHLYVRINDQVFLPPDPDLDREEQVRHIVETEMYDIISNSSSSWNLKYKAWKIDPDRVIINGVDSCPMLTVIHPMSKRLISIISVRVGEIGQSYPCFTDGKPLVTARCQGDFVNGASWVDYYYHMDCTEMIGSIVTDALQKLSEGVVSHVSGVALQCTVKMQTLGPCYKRTPPQYDFNPQQIIGSIAELRVSMLNADGVVDDMNRLTEDPDILTAPDIIYTSLIMENVGRARHLRVTVGDKLVRTVSSLLNSDENALGKAQSLTQASKKIITSLSNYANQVDLEERETAQFIQQNIALQVWEVDSAKPVLGFQSNSKSQRKGFSNASISSLYSRSDLEFDDAECAILFPQEVFSIHDVGPDGQLGPDADMSGMIMPKKRVTFTVYKNDDLFQTPERLNRSKQYSAANSQIISGNVAGRRIKNLKNPVKTVFRPFKDMSDTSEVKCVFWDLHANEGLGDWSEEGCWYSGTENGRHVCSCDHLTNFAILVDIYDKPHENEDVTAALSWLSTFGLALSILGLTLTIITYLVFRKFRTSRSQKTLLNLAVALLCAMLVFVAGVDKTDNYYACLVVSAMLHYFILVAFMWMLIEAVINYIRFVKVMGTYISQFMLKTIPTAWGVPFIPVIIVASVDYNLYKGRSNYCWMSEYPLYFAFMLPIGLVIVINTVLYTLIIKGMTCDRGKGLKTNQKKSKLMWMQVNAALSCFVVLGLTWIFGFLAIADARTVFQFFFCIFNSVQGFLIFFFYIVRCKQARNQWVRLCCRKEVQKKYLATSSVMSENSSNKVTMSTTATSSNTASYA